MITNATHLLAPITAKDARPLQIVLTFDHPAMADAVRLMLASFLTKWAPEVDVHRDEWSFDELAHPKCRIEALELARNCDIFVIAIAGANDLPDSIAQWIDEWLQSREALDTAIILCTSNGGGQIREGPCCGSLPSKASASGLSFFSTSLPLPRNETSGIKSPVALLKTFLFNNESSPEFSSLND